STGPGWAAGWCDCIIGGSFPAKEFQTAFQTMKAEESLLANVKMAPRDAILGLTELYVADPNPKKVNLGVGVYYDDQGKVPLLECVKKADDELARAGIARPYLAMDGFPDYVRQVQSLLFGPK